MIKEAKILFPKESIDKSKYSVIACDQFTSQEDYWTELKNVVGKSKSTLNLIFPEIYLENNNKKRINQINKNIKNYLNSDTFIEKEGLVLVERTLNNQKKRIGLMLLIDLDEYSYEEKNNKLIKATERTVKERLPIRIEIRKNASIELPHIMLLMDDKEEKILEKLYQKRDSFEKIYDFDLNMNGGHLKGYLIKDSKEIINDILKLKEKRKEMLFAVGDGNHSLATAKECWEIKKKKSKEDDPAKYALCELVSLYDSSLEFEPIHRAIFNADEDFIKKIKEKLNYGKHCVKLIFKSEEHFIKTKDATNAIKDIQDFIDTYIKEHKEIEIDYIHNDYYLVDICRKKNAIGIFMPTIQKEELFDYAIERGVLPRKSFSMGIAEDKRYYLEARKIKI